MTNLTNTIENKVSFYEGSYQFKVDTTTLNISEDYVRMQLARQHEYRPTKETLWAIVVMNGEEKRYRFDYQNGLTEIILN